MAVLNRVTVDPGRLPDHDAWYLRVAAIAHLASHGLDLNPRGTWVVLATHSPVLAAFPGATIVEFTEHGIEEREWEHLELVSHWRSFMAAPQSYLRHLFA